MFKEFIEKIMEISEPHFHESISGEYTDKKLNRLPNDLRAEPFTVLSLSGLVDYLKHFAHDMKEVPGYFVHVVSPTEVRVTSGLDEDRDRETLVKAVAEVPAIPFKRFLDNEEMIIVMQSMFADEKQNPDGTPTDYGLVLKFAGTVVNGSVTEYGDDGVTQKATVKSGIKTLSEAVVPNPCTLRPYRTFPEVEQPASQFIFRMREDKPEAVCSALFEADGGAWKNEARQNIADYLAQALEFEGITIPVIC